MFGDLLQFVETTSIKPVDNNRLAASLLTSRDKFFLKKLLQAMRRRLNISFRSILLQDVNRLATTCMFLAVYMAQSSGLRS